MTATYPVTYSARLCNIDLCKFYTVDAAILGANAAQFESSHPVDEQLRDANHVVEVDQV